MVSPRFMGRNGADGKYDRDNAYEEGMHRALSPRPPVQHQYDRASDAFGGDRMSAAMPGLRMGSPRPGTRQANGGGKEISSAPQTSSSRFGFMQALQVSASAFHSCPTTPQPHSSSPLY